MTVTPNSDKPPGWDYIFQHGFVPPRYLTSAAPNDSVVEWAETLPPGAAVVDIGCGIGRHALYLGGRGFKMAGMDISPTGVNTTQVACAEQHIAFDGRVADMLALPWADETFDAALSTSVIGHNRVVDIRKTLEEVRRILKPGGLFLVDFPHKDTLSYQRTRAQVVEGILTEVEPDTFVDEHRQLDLGDDAFLPHHFCDEAEVRDLLGSFDILKLWADLLHPPDGGLPQRGYWVAWVQRPFTD